MIAPKYVVIQDGRGYCYFDETGLTYRGQRQVTDSKFEALELRDELRKKHPNYTYEAHEITLGEKLP